MLIIVQLNTRKIKSYTILDIYIHDICILVHHLFINKVQFEQKNCLFMYVFATRKKK